MQKFLESVARYYLAKGADHRDTTLVFPNKRSTLFMRRYLKRAADGAVFMPRLITMGSLLAQMAEGTEASRTEQLFTLYDAYFECRSRLGGTPMDFDRFRFWGEMMLDDFDDIDHQMVDVHDIFANVKNLHEIRTDFLTDEQRDVARELWGYDPVQEYDRFWRHVGGAREKNQEAADTAVYDGFVALTEMLGPIYASFVARLSERGLTTAGRIARTAAETADAYARTLAGRVGFVGMGVLSRAERKVMSELQKAGVADFFWNTPTGLQRDLPEGIKSTAPLSRYIARLERRFPMPVDYEAPEMTESPQVDIVSVPSRSMQTKVAANILTALQDNHLINDGRADSTAIIMPDPSLLVPLLHSLPVELHSVNITMGLPYRHTPFATLLSAVIRLHSSATRDHEGQPTYLTDNVARILTHPSMSVMAPEACANLRKAMARHPRFHTPLSLIREKAPEVAFLFEPLPADASATVAAKSLIAIIDGLTALIRDNAAADTGDVHEMRVLEAYRAAVESLTEIIAAHPIASTADNDDVKAPGALTFYKLVEKSLARQMINLKGAPLRGVQVMGALESRNLDFDNVIFLSLNENSFPPKNFMRSLIPAPLRVAYGLTTVDEREMQYSWIFHSLLSRTQRAWLLYDATGERDGAGRSRYIRQIENIYTGLKARVNVINPSGVIADAEVISVPKDDVVKERLRRFLPGGDLRLSASSLKTYMHCPLQFYFKTVLRVPEERRALEYIDPASMGTIVHAVLEDLYNKHVRDGNGGRVDETFIVSEDDLQNLIVKTFDDRYYFGRYGGNKDRMPGEALMMIGVLTKCIGTIVKMEKARGPYTFVGSEVQPGYDIEGRHKTDADTTFDWRLDDELTVRFTYSIDRVDRSQNGRLRFIDYKTGSDKLEAGMVTSLFDADDTSSNDAIFQLLTYAHAYNDMRVQNGFEPEENIDLEITKVYYPALSVGKPLIVRNALNKKEALDGYADAKVSDFRTLLVNLIHDIFNPDINFKQTENVEKCRYCQFLSICGRQVPEKSW